MRNRTFLVLILLVVHLEILTSALPNLVTKKLSPVLLMVIVLDILVYTAVIKNVLTVCSLRMVTVFSIIIARQILRSDYYATSL